MSNKKILISIHDDWELLGNGLGNVASHQYLPSLFLMKLADKYGFKPTFMVDTAQAIAYEKYAEKCQNIATQFSLWKKNIQLMKLNGHDVQLHIHPQWLYSDYNNNYFTVDNRYNIGLYSKDEQEYLISAGIKLLKDLLVDIDSKYKTIAFKAGGWGLQPSESLMKIFDKNGISIVLGPRKKLIRKSLNIDYSKLEEDTFPYYPNINNIVQIGPKSNTIILPLTYVKIDLYNQIRLIKDSLYSTYNQKYNDQYLNYSSPPKNISNKNHYSFISRFQEMKLYKNKYYSHLKIGGKSYKFMINCFEQAINRYIKQGLYNVPMIIESHTKNYFGRYNDLDMFFKFILDKYSHKIEFVYLSDIKNLIAENNILVKKNESID
tara:strand:+ start:2781 stop:3911 length:1131 start_codon:yes stop_codon:yes gene_type:complete